MKGDSVSYGTRPPTLPKRPTSSGGGGGGLPAWLIFVMAIALVFGGYYLWQGAQSFLQTGGLGVEEATQRAVIITTATARSQPRATTANVFGLTLQPSATPIPPCQDFVVSVEQPAIVRNAPTQRGEIVRTLNQGDIVCVVGREGETEWYILDTNPLTTRLDAAYMREDLIEPLNPTLTPSQTFTPAPTVTPMPTWTPSLSPTPTLSPTRDERLTDTPTPTLTPSPTQAIQNA